MNTKIFVDSACDLPNEIIKKYNVEVLPFNIHINNDKYLDGIEIDTSDVYQAIREDKSLSTSQVAPHIFEKAFRKEAEKGNDCIYISFSSQMSGAYQTGKMMAEKIKNEFENIKIKIIDSRAGSGATGLIVYKAAQLLSDNIPLEKVVKAVKFWAEHIEHLFILDDLKQLQKGGRISKTKSFIGNILNIKPILHVKEGKIELLQKSRGTKKAINELIKLFKQKSYNIKEQLIAVTHADDLNKAQILKKKIEDLGGEVFFTEMIGGVLGTHLGIRGVGIFFFNKKWE